MVGPDLRISQRMLDWLRTPRALWAVPVLGALLAGCTALLAQAMWPPNRVATARIALDPSAAGAGGAAQEWIAAQVALMGSERVARRVVRDLGAQATPTSGDFDGDGAALHLLSNLEVEPQGPDGLVSIRYRSPSSAFSAQVANSFVTAYDRVSQEIQAGIAASAQERARQRISELRDAVNRAQARVQGVDNVSLRADAGALVEAARVARLASEVTWSGSGEMRGTEDPPGVLSNSTVDASPRGGWADDPMGAGRLQSARDELDLARQAFVAAQARFTELNGQQIFGRPALTVIDPAEAAHDPGENRRSTVVWIAAVVGLAAGLLLRPLAQWVDPRVRGSHDLIPTLGLPVFGALVNAERAARVGRPRGRTYRGSIDASRAVPALQ
jgi:uncharacterized protein involved in exopolysaccharide biosynthesis